MANHLVEIHRERMSIGVETPRELYVGNALTTVFPVNFTYGDDSDVVVFVNGSQITAGFSVTEQGVEFETAPETESSVAILRLTDLDQPSAFNDPQRLSIEEVGRSLDRIVRQLQELNGKQSRSLILPLDSTSITEIKNTPNTAIFFDAEGNAKNETTSETLVRLGDTSSVSSDQAREFANEAEESASLALLSQQSSSASESSARDSRDASELSAASASSSELSSAASREAALNSQQAAEAHASDSIAASQSSQTSALNAEDSAIEAKLSEIIALDKATEASSSSDSAELSAIEAASSKDSASNSEVAAQNIADNLAVDIEVIDNRLNDIEQSVVPDQNSINDLEALSPASSVPEGTIRIVLNDPQFGRVEVEVRDYSGLGKAWLPNLAPESIVTPSDIDPSTLVSIVPENTNQLLVDNRAVVFISTGTEAGDWDFYDNRELILMGGINERRGVCNNTGRSGSSNDVVSFIKDGRPYIWGRVRVVGQMPVANSIGYNRIHPFTFEQHPTRPHPDYVRSKVGTLDKVVRIKIQHFDFGHCLTESGMVFGWHILGSQVAHMTGSNGISRATDTAVPILFANGNGTNQPIRDFDTGSYRLTGEFYGGLFIGLDDSVWLMTNNNDNYGFNASIPTTGTVRPTRIDKAEWSGLTPKKVRVGNGRSYYVLFTNGHLYACGLGLQGQFGNGSTAALHNFELIASDVRDFDINQDTGGSNLSYCVNNASSLLGTGDNGSGWISNGNVTNVSSYDLIDTEVTRVISGGNGTNHAIAYLKNDLWYRVGENSRGTFGNSSITDINTAQVWTELNDLITQNGKLIDIGFGAYSTSGLTLCAMLFQNGKIFSAGEGSLGQLGDGIESDSTVFVESEYQLERGETPTSLCFMSSAAATPTPHFGFTTNFGNLFLTGDDAYGFSSGGGTVAGNGSYSTFKKIHSINQI